MSTLGSIVGHLWMAPAGYAVAFVTAYAAHAWRWRKSRWLREWEAAQRPASSPKPIARLTR